MPSILIGAFVFFVFVMALGLFIKGMFWLFVTGLLFFVVLSVMCLLGWVALNHHRH